MVETTPYWWKQAPRPETQNIELPSSIDVAVIGAGFTGLCTALSLARGGASVVVFEAGVLGYGASTRIGGMVGPSFAKVFFLLIIWRIFWRLKALKPISSDPDVSGGL